MDKHQHQAICQMAESLHDYNRGVLAMLGKAGLASAYEQVSKTIDILVHERNKHIQPDAGVFDPLPPEAKAIQEKIDAAVKRQSDAWAPIQAIIDQSRAALESGDPLGLYQAV